MITNVVQDLMSHHAGASHVENTVPHTKYQRMYCTVLMAPLPFLLDHPFVLQAVIINNYWYLLEERTGQDRAGNNIIILILLGSIFSTQLSGALSFYVLWCVCCVSREFKKLRRQLQGKRHIKIELCVNLSLLPLFHVDHVVQNRQSALSLVWHKINGFHVMAKNERFTTASSRCRQNLKYENFTSSFGRLRQNIAPKSMPHMRHDHFSSFNQWNHWFVALSLTFAVVKS